MRASRARGLTGGRTHLLAQIWFRGGADYVISRADIGVFTLGSFPRDPDEGARLHRLADEIHRVTAGETMLVREASTLLGHHQPTAMVWFSGLTGRVLIHGMRATSG